MRGTTADALIGAYSTLQPKEQRAFDKRYKDLMRFRRDLKVITDAILGKPDRKRGQTR